MLIRDRIKAREYPINLAYEILMNNGDTEEKLPEDIIGSMYYILNTALNDKRRKILEMHWRDKMTLEKIGIVMDGMSKQTVQEIEKKALRILRDPKWSKFVIHGVSGVIESEKYYKKKLIERELNELSDPLNISLMDLEFPVRIYNSLKRTSRISTAGDIKNEMEKDCCKKIRNLGKKSIIEILNKFDELGIEINNMLEVFEKWNITRQDLLT